MSDSSAVSIRYVEQTTAGVLPTDTRTGIFSAVATGNKITHAAAGNKFDGLSVGQKITTAGSAVPANNAELTIVSINLTLDPQEVVVSGATLVDASDITSIETPPTMRGIFMTGESLNDSESLNSSGGIRADLNMYNGRVTKRTIGGSINFEFKNDLAHDDFLAAAITSDGFGTETSFTGSIEIVSGTSRVEIAAASNAFADVKVGQVLKLTGSVTNTEDSYLLEVVSIDTTGDPHFITFNEINGYTMVDEVIAAGTIKGKMMRNGTSCRRFMMEKEFRPSCSGSDDYNWLFEDMFVDTYNLTATANEKLTGDIGFMGSGVRTSSEPAIPFAGTVIDESTADYINAADNLTVIKDNAATTTSFLINDFSIAIASRAREIPAIGYLYNAGHGLNSLNLTLSLTMYFNNAASYNSYRNEDKIFPRLVAVDPTNGTTYIYSFPSTILSGGDLSGAALDANYTISYGATEARLFTDSTGETYTVQVDKIEA